MGVMNADKFYGFLFILTNYPSIIQHTWIPLLKIDIRTVPIFAIGLECHTIWQESVEPVYLFVLEVLVKPGSK